MPGVSAGTISTGTITAVPVILSPGRPGVAVPASAVSGRSFASFTNDNTVANGLNSLGTSVSVLLQWQASTGGPYYQIAACTVSGGGTASTCGIGVSTMASETVVRLVGVQPSAVGPSVVIAPSAVVTASAAG